MDEKEGEKEEVGQTLRLLMIDLLEKKKINPDTMEQPLKRTDSASSGAQTVLDKPSLSLVCGEVGVSYQTTLNITPKLTLVVTQTVMRMSDTQPSSSPGVTHPDIQHDDMHSCEGHPSPRNRT